MKTVVITGGTDGIGRALAALWLARGERVVVVGRSADKGAAFLAAARELRAEDRARFVRADLSLVVDNRRLVDLIGDEVEAVDALVLCARYHRSARVETVEGFESTFALFYLSRYLLSHGLLPLLERATSPVIANVAGPGGTRPIAWEDLQLARDYHGVGALGHGGRLNDLLAVSFAERHPDARTRYGLFHPGIVSTSFSGEYDSTEATRIVRLKREGKPVEQAIQPIVAFVDRPPAAPVSATVEGAPYALDRSSFDPAEAHRLDVLTGRLLAETNALGEARWP